MSVQNQSSLPPEGTKDLPHFVSDAPFDLRSVEKLTPEQEKIYFASQLTLMWWKFKRHRVAVWSGIFLLLLYGSVLVSEFLQSVQTLIAAFAKHLCAHAIADHKTGIQTPRHAFKAGCNIDGVADHGKLQPVGPDVGQNGRIGTDEDLLQGEDVYRRARELLDEIRRRSGDQQRPTEELDYLKRLLDRF